MHASQFLFDNQHLLKNLGDNLTLFIDMMFYQKNKNKNKLIVGRCKQIKSMYMRII